MIGATRTAVAQCLHDSDTARRLVDQLDRTCARLRGTARAGRCAAFAAWLDEWCV